MRAFPTGTVTFLFTDVEGSTRLLQLLAERYRDVKERHDAILRAAIAEGGGVELGTEGDSFFAVFPSPVGAVTAAVKAQRALAEPGWPDGVAVRVRMGLHTGEGILVGDNYLGLDVNRAARIAAAAHGGQLLVSDATRCLVERSPPAQTHLRDLGQHRLKDLTQPERLHQVVVEGLEQDFPSPRTLDARPNNLPAQLTRLIGRDEEIARLTELLAANRLVTLTGTGGTGKTRLALAVAAEALDDFGDGVFFVDLSAVADPDVVPSTVAAALRVRAEAGRPAIATVADHLREKKLLLLLDNFEHLLDAASTVLEPLLREAPAVTVLVTSRIPLRLYGEQQFHVPPLAVAEQDRVLDAKAVAQSAAVALFAERAAAVRPEFRVTEPNAPVIAEITARLDGLPLAIELAASRIKLLSPEQLLGRLEQRLPLLAATDRNVPERQRTVRRTIDWSHELLGPAEQRMFARLSVFAGGADLDAVEAIVNPGGELDLDTLDGLAALVENNLVRSFDPPDAAPRFGMLETIREYGLERLTEGGEEEIIRCRHAQHWVEVAGRAAERLSGPEQALWTRRLELDHDNFRAALSWALRSGEAEVGLRLAAALDHFWRVAGHIGEGLRWLDELLALPRSADLAVVRARALAAAGGLAPWVGAIDAQMRYAQEAAAIFKDVGDSDGLVHALSALGWGNLHTGNLQVARELLEEAKSVAGADSASEIAANCDLGLGVLALTEGRAGDARSHLENALRMYGGTSDPYWVAFTEMLLGYVDRLEGRLDAAESRFRASLTRFRESNTVMMAATLVNAFADLALQRRQHERALRLAGASDALREPFGEKSPLEQASTVDVREALRSVVDEATMADLYEQGRVMELDEAVAYALEQESLLGR
jgi:predicted ATPase/class 3 adenylate cyclase